MLRPCLLSTKGLNGIAIKQWICRYRYSELFVSGKAYICRKNVNLVPRTASREIFKCGNRIAVRMKCAESAQGARALQPDSKGEDEEAFPRVKEQPVGIGFRDLTCEDDSAEEGESVCVGWEVTAWPGGEESAHHVEILAARGTRETTSQHKEASGDCAEKKSVDMNAGQRTESRGQENGAELQEADSGILALHPAGYDNVKELHIQKLEMHSAGYDSVKELYIERPPDSNFRTKDDGMAGVGSKDSALDRTLESGEVWLDGLQQIKRTKSSSGVEVEAVSVDTFPTKTISGDFDGGKLAKSINDLATQVVDGTQKKVDEDSKPIDQTELHRGKEPLDKCITAESLSQYPVPLSPLSGEAARTIEYERALVAESASNSGPAMTRSGVLFEDEWLLVLNKPCGIYSEHVLATVPSLVTPTTPPAFSLSSLTLQLPIHNKEVSSPHFHMANRLDRDTSGVMVVTKSRRAAGKMSNIFTKRLVQKSYIALCTAQRPSWKRLTIESGHGRSRFGAWRVYSKKDVGRGLPGGSVVRDMITRLEVVSINKQIGCDLPDDQTVKEIDETPEYIVVGDDTSPGIFQGSPCDMVGTSEESVGEGTPPSEGGNVVIRAIPMTGRTHQIRLHCQFVGLSLKGDVKYGGSHIQNGVRSDHHFLHAETLSFKHPFTFEELHFVAPYPQWAINAGVQPLVS